MGIVLIAKGDSDDVDEIKRTMKSTTTPMDDKGDNDDDYDDDDDEDDNGVAITMLMSLTEATVKYKISNEKKWYL